MNCLPSGKIEVLKNSFKPVGKDYMKKIVTVRGSTFLPEGVVISQKKSNPGSNFNLGSIYWGVPISPKISTEEYLFRGVHFYGDTG